MTTIYTPEQTAAIIDAIKSVMLSNNGHAEIGNCPTVATALGAAGFVVVVGNDLHGNPVKVAYTAKAWDIHATEAIDRYRAVIKARLNKSDRVGFEARILARNDRHLFA